eukprot:5053805-Prymnesium_polylepis.1
MPGPCLLVDVCTVQAVGRGEGESRTHLRTGAHHRADALRRQVEEHQILDHALDGCCLVDAIEDDDERLEFVRLQDHLLLVPRRLLVDVGQQQVVEALTLAGSRITGNALHTDEQRDGLRALGARLELLGKDPGELLQAPRLARARSGANEHRLRLVRTLGSLRRRLKQHFGEARHVVHATPA